MRYLATLAWMAVIFQASGTPDLKAVPLAQRFGFLPDLLGPAMTDLLELLLRKGAHMISFGILALLTRWTLAGSFPRVSMARLSAAAFGFAVLYAMSDEFHQTFVPTRDGKVTDILIDAAGAALALLLAYLVRGRIRGKGYLHRR